MPRWTIDSPRTLELPDVAALRVRVISGSVAILASPDPPSLDVASLAGQPLLVTHEAGILTVTYEDLQPGGLRGWLRPQRHTADVTITVPRGCPTQVSVVNASVIVSGIAANVCVESTLRHAFFLDYWPILVSDCTMAAGGPEVLAATIFNVESFFGWTVTSDELRAHLAAREA